MIAGNRATPDIQTSTPVPENWLATASALGVAGMRRQQHIARTIAEVSAEVAEEYAEHMRRLCHADDPITAWACHEAWVRHCWSAAQDRAARVGQAFNGH